MARGFNPLPNELYPSFEHPAPASSRISAFPLPCDTSADVQEGSPQLVSRLSGRLAKQAPGRAVCEAAAGCLAALPSKSPLRPEETRTNVTPFREGKPERPALLGKSGSISSGLPQLTQKEIKEYQQRYQKQARRLARFALQDAARALLPGEAVAGCLRYRQSIEGGVSLLYNREKRAASFAGLQTCGSVWGCPVCAAKISERRRVELRRAVDAWRAKGGTVVLATYTASHALSDDLAGLLGAPARGTHKRGDYVPARGLLGARSVAMSGRAYNDIKLAGLVGSVRALEVTFGESGWHPHIHELLFLAPELGEEARAAIEQALEAAWRRGLAAVGLSCNEHGFDWQDAGGEVEAYLAKAGCEDLQEFEAKYGRGPRVWDCSAEVAKQPAKLGRAKGRTPMQLLADYAAGPGEVAARSGALFVTYARAMKGRHQLQWSHGLRGLLGLGVELSDTELAEQPEQGGETLLELDNADWSAVLFWGARAALQDVAEATDGDALAVVAYVARLRDNLAPEHARRIARSLKRSERRHRDAARALQEAEAAELGLTWHEWRMYQRGGMNAIAVPAAVAVLLPSPGVSLLVEQSVPASAVGPGLFDEVEKPCGLAVFGSGVPVFLDRLRAKKQDAGREGGEKHGARQNKASGSLG